MASLPCPAPSTLPEINAEYLGELEQGGASLVVCDDEHAHLGVTARDRAVSADARAADREPGGRATRAVSRGAGRRSTKQPKMRRRR